MSFDKNTIPTSIPVAMLTDFVGLVGSDDDEKRMYGTMMIRKLLAVELDPPIDAVIESGVCPLLGAFLTRNDFPELQLEAAWALSNVAAGTEAHTRYIVDLDLIQHFIALLSSPSEDCREQAAFGIGNLTADNVEFRDRLLQSGAMEPLLHMISTPSRKKILLRHATWALSNLCYGNPPLPIERATAALSSFATLLSHEDEPVLTEACLGVSYISAGPSDRVQLILDAGLLPAVVSLFSSSSSSVLIPAVVTIGNVAGGDDKHTKAVVNSGALAQLYGLLLHPMRLIGQAACWALSNIAATAPDEIQAIINANLFPILLSNTLLSRGYEILKEALWVVANAASCGTSDQVCYLAEIGVLMPLVAMLSLNDAELLAVALDAITNILYVGEEEKREGGLGYNRFAAMLTNVGGLVKIEALRDHTDTEVSNRAESIWTTVNQPSNGAVESHQASISQTSHATQHSGALHRRVTMHKKRKFEPDTGG